ncbi:hypothetical protein LINGRAHAP2_LOCUS33560, partial [Linum grandiflorum]
MYTQFFIYIAIGRSSSLNNDSTSTIPAPAVEILLVKVRKKPPNGQHHSNRLHPAHPIIEYRHGQQRSNGQRDGSDDIRENRGHLNHQHHHRPAENLEAQRRP